MHLGGKSMNFTSRKTCIFNSSVTVHHVVAIVSNNKNSIVYLPHIGSALGACLNYLI